MNKKNSFVQSYFSALFKIALEEKGYSVIDHGRYIIAENDSNRYLIQKVCRLLSSNGSIDESSVIDAKKSVVDKLRVEAEKLGCKPALAYGVSKYTYQDSEIMIAALDEWNEEERPAYLSQTARGYYFNYKHVNSGGIEKAIVRAVIQIQYDNRCKK